ncbi:imidazole glycerol phosphate synthase subunit HisH [Oceanobacillus caeni]|uniref:imidazole glycerol phosphate synthase subunit HisH n=1 Tax=Oceanobacillus caeni TaxID=405946 RepID=UPI0006218315|nr:imidazole glycerol phosphate synthase subunit HisH [Oceanobacillus caeni]KKE79481.1 imidazole glycerol phosphate synthase [Bacilli bacterium VT-13-104]PZD83668.1 imidazole glycerol phosphate synthase subunit HisH [Bacilli bacterium]MCR1834848.1 imidazole glycerol phosphate synthase subunit HisH [Oceanobacillus caeni]PZD84808.1 imidazole glycerol phosphate synthase subunit HisH [Bacilli bacterium]PZD87145.1 imidazole glycerol phosphate synthase subunit HisH [Bacilli bacterium]
MIAIIDYDAGNIKSLQFALNKLKMESVLTKDPEIIKNSSSIILPGVGAFKDAIASLNELGMTEVIREEVMNGKPILGICLGMQLFYETSYEDGEWEGIGLLKGSVNRIPDMVKVPHMGWNTIQKHQESPLFHNISEGPFVYFVHSYAIGGNYEKDTLVSSSQYGITVPAIVQKGNVTGMQFHPEKSGDVGLQLLKNYEEMIS